jgi:O-succinylhomoserine sulfhydrylase
MTADDGGVPSVRIPAPLPDGVSRETIGVRGGLLRSGFDETAEALYLTSGYVYDSAAEAEKAFTGEIDRFVYSRYGNPTVAMFEERWNVNLAWECVRREAEFLKLKAWGVS